MSSISLSFLAILFSFGNALRILPSPKDEGSLALSSYQSEGSRTSSMDAPNLENKPKVEAKEKPSMSDLSDTLISAGIEIFGSKEKLMELVNASKVDYFNMKDLCDGECAKELRSPSAVFMEIGANIGVATVYAVMTIPGLKTVGVEASPRSAFYAKWNLEANGIPEGDQHVLLNRAIGCDGSTDFQECNIARGSGLTTSREDWDCAATTVQCIDLRDIIAKQQIDQIALLRQDCEGCEFTSLPQWKQDGLLSKIRYWQGEYHPRFKSNFVAQDNLETEEILCQSFKDGVSTLWGNFKPEEHCSV